MAKTTIKFTLTLSERLMDAFAQTGAEDAEAVKTEICNYLHSWFDEVKEDNPADADEEVA